MVKGMSTKGATATGPGFSSPIAVAAASCLILSCTGGGASMINTLVPEICKGLDITTVQWGVQAMISSIVAFLSGFAGTKFFDLLTPKWVFFIGSICEGLYLIIAATTHSYFIYILSGLLNGFAMGAGTFASVAGLMGMWYGENSGKMFGVSTGIQVFLIAIYIFVFGRLLNVMSYRGVLFIVAGMNIIVGCGLNLLLIRQPKGTARMLRENREKASALAEAIDEATSDDAAASSKQSQFDGLTVYEAFKKPSLYLLLLGMMAGAIIVGGMSSYGTTFFVSFGMSTADASSYMSLYTIFCGIHVLWTGFFQNKFGSKVFIVVQYAGILIGIALLIMWANSKAMPLVILGLFLFAFIKPVNSTPALLVPDLFGRKYYTSFNSLTTGFYYGGICISMLSTAAIMTALGGSKALLYMGIMAVLALVVFFVALVLSPYRKMKKAQADAAHTAQDA